MKWGDIKTETANGTKVNWLRTGRNLNKRIIPRNFFENNDSLYFFSPKADEKRHAIPMAEFEKAERLAFALQVVKAITAAVVMLVGFITFVWVMKALEILMEGV